MLHRPNFNIGFLTFFNSTGTVCIDRQPSSAMSQLEDGLIIYLGASGTDVFKYV